MATSEIGRPAVLYETGEDESFLLGTRSQLTSLANEILRLLELSGESRDWNGIGTEQIASPKSLSDPMSDIVIDGIVIVQSEFDRRSLMNHIRVSSGDMPIDWVGHDEPGDE